MNKILSNIFCYIAFLPLAFGISIADNKIIGDAKKIISGMMSLQEENEEEYITVFIKSSVCERIELQGNSIYINDNGQTFQLAPNTAGIMELKRDGRISYKGYNFAGNFTIKSSFRTVNIDGIEFKGDLRVVNNDNNIQLGLVISKSEFVKRIVANDIQNYSSLFCDDLLDVLTMIAKEDISNMSKISRKNKLDWDVRYTYDLFYREFLYIKFKEYVDSAYKRTLNNLVVDHNNPLLEIGSYFEVENTKDNSEFIYGRKMLIDIYKDKIYSLVSEQNTPIDIIKNILGGYISTQ